MTAGRHGRLWVALAVALSVCFALLAHFAIVDGAPPALGALLSLVPVSFLAIWAVRRLPPALALTLVLAAAVALWLGWDALKSRFAHLFFLEHAATNLLLAIVFGRTLAGGREALCTRLARVVHGELDAHEVLYTRRVTLAWTVFFAAIFMASTVLYLGHFLAAWSLLANIATPVLVGAMFVIEYAVRVRVLPSHAGVGIMGGIRAFSRHIGDSRYEAPR